MSELCSHTGPLNRRGNRLREFFLYAEHVPKVALVRHYHAEEEQRTPPEMSLGERALRVFRSVQKMCEWRLGRSSFPGETEMPESGLPVPELVRCLREIQKSIPRWSRQGGRKGYLDFVSQYLP